MSDFPTLLSQLANNPLQQIDSDLQALTLAVNRVGTLLADLIALQSGQIVTGSRAGNAALANLLTALANAGIVVDNTTA